MGRYISVKPLGIGAAACFRKAVRKYGVAIAAIVILGAWTMTVNTIATYRATKATEERLNAYWKNYCEEQLKTNKDEWIAANIPASDTVLKLEAEQVAKVLYGVKDNSTDDLKTYAWCIFNRVDSRSFPDTLEEVIAQPSQWMAYHKNNPVLESLYQIALGELQTWHNGHRPVSSDYVYMSWSPKEIVLRNSWQNGSGTRYWRWEA